LKATLSIRGMSCEGCVQRLTKAFSNIPGVVGARVTLDPPAAEIESRSPVAARDLAAAARSAGDYSVSVQGEEARSPGGHAAHVAESTPAEPRQSLYPLVLIVGYIAAAAALTTWFRGERSWHTLMNDFMAGFFLVFSFFKLLDLRGFAGAYRSYDILARAWAPWGFIYPFLELALGVAYLVRWQPAWTNTATLALMLFGSVGVFRAVLRKDAIRCACLGTAVNLPLTTVTLVEDAGMAAMAAISLLWAS